MVPGRGRGAHPARDLGQRRGWAPRRRPGDDRRTVALAVRHGAAVGAHPGYPDLAGFGRRAMALSPEEIEAIRPVPGRRGRGFARAAGRGCARQGARRAVQPRGPGPRGRRCDRPGRPALRPVARARGPRGFRARRGRPRRGLRWPRRRSPTAPTSPTGHSARASTPMRCSTTRRPRPRPSRSRAAASGPRRLPAPAPRRHDLRPRRLAGRGGTSPRGPGGASRRPASRSGRSATRCRGLMAGPRILPFGEAALLVELDDVGVDRQARRARAVAAAIDALAPRRRPWSAAAGRGERARPFDPEVAGVDEVASLPRPRRAPDRHAGVCTRPPSPRRLARAPGPLRRRRRARPRGRRHELGLSAADVVELHAGPSTRSCSWASRRLRVPRRGPCAARRPAPGHASGRVPAGSVAITGSMTAIYPQPSPGGWRILGRTGERLFDPAASPPARLRPGDRRPLRPRLMAGTEVLEVVEPGLLTTVQDGGGRA